MRIWSTLGCVVAMWNVVEPVADHALRSVLMGQEPEPKGQRNRSMGSYRSRKASASVMRKHWVKEVIEVGGWKTGKGGKEDVDGREGGQAVHGVIARAKQDPELDGHEQWL